MKKLIILSFALSLCCQLQAVVIAFNLEGLGGAGLLPGNELHGVTSGGTGGESGGGISYDTDTNILTINAAWGSGNGFTDLSGAATSAHIHGVTSSGAAGFNETAGVKYNLSSILSTSASSGGLSGTIAIGGSDENSLLNGQTYINVHTVLNAGGEIRAQLVAVPEPATYGLLIGLGCGLFAALRRRTQN